MTFQGQIRLGPKCNFGNCIFIRRSLKVWNHFGLVHCLTMTSLESGIHLKGIWHPLIQWYRWIARDLSGDFGFREWNWKSVIYPLNFRLKNMSTFKKWNPNTFLICCPRGGGEFTGDSTSLAHDNFFNNIQSVLEVSLSHYWCLCSMTCFLCVSFHIPGHSGHIWSRIEADKSWKFLIKYLVCRFWYVQ